MDHITADSLLAAYLLDAIGADETVGIEAHLAMCPDCTATVAELRTAVEHLGAITTTAPPPELRARLLAEATNRRPGGRVRFVPAEVHLIESSRLLALLDGLTPEQWATRVGPQFPDWSVQDLAAHLGSSESLLATQLGVDPVAPEFEDQPEARAHAAVARHRGLSPAETLRELTAIYESVQQGVVVIGPAVESTVVSMYGTEFTLGFGLTQRSFEIWTHADDIRRALGLSSITPPPPSIESMSSAVVDTIPVMLAATGVDADGRRARLTLSGPGGGTYDLDLGLDVASPSAEPDVVIELDVIDFCLAIGDRLAPGETPYRATGDTDLAAGIVAALPALAVL